MRQTYHQGFGQKRVVTNRLNGRLAILLIVFLFAAAIVAAALTASRPAAPIPKLWLQNPPSIVTKLPGSFWVDEMLF